MEEKNNCDHPHTHTHCDQYIWLRVQMRCECGGLECMSALLNKHMCPVCGKVVISSIFLTPVTMGKLTCDQPRAG